MQNIYYVYAYIRSKDSATAKAGTPYYIGKGKKNRAYAKHSVSVPSDTFFIVFLEKNLTHLGACALERRLIEWYGRKDIGTGILLNRTDGGEGTANVVYTETRREKLRQAQSGKPKDKDAISKGVATRRKNNTYAHTTETREKMKQSHQNRPPQSEETKRKRSETLKNKPKSVEHKAALSRAKKGKTPWNKGLTKDDPRVKKYADRVITDEMRENFSARMKGRKKSPEHLQKMSDSAKAQWAKKKSDQANEQKR